MKKLILTVCISVSLLAMAACGPSASKTEAIEDTVPSASPDQNPSASPANAAPLKEITPPPSQADFDPPTLSASDTGQVCLFGWSKAGLIAMVSRRAWSSEKPSSGLEYNYSVIDMVSDKVMWGDSDSVVTSDTADSGEEIELNDAQAIAISWQKMGPKVRAKLHEYGINPARGDLNPVPFLRDGRQFQANAALQINNDDENASYYTVSIARDDGKSKELLRISRKDDGSPPWWYSEITVLGAWLSPYEDRIALVYLLNGRGFEADSISSVRATGCLLKGNF